MTTLAIERRYFKADEIRVSRSHGKQTIQGHAAVFHQLSEDLGGFREKIAPGAFADTLDADVRALFNHDRNFVLGRTTSGTLRMSEDKTGLKVEIDPPDTTVARDLMTSIERGDISQMSFGFRVKEDEWEQGIGDNPDIRTLLAVELFDVSPVTFPAYPQTDVGLRSNFDIHREGRKRLGKGKTRLELCEERQRRVNHPKRSPEDCLRIQAAAVVSLKNDAKRQRLSQHDAALASLPAKRTVKPSLLQEKIEVRWTTEGSLEGKSYKFKIDPVCADLRFMNSGDCPVLMSHKGSPIGYVLARSSFIDDGQGFCDIRLLDSCEGRSVAHEIKMGRLTGASIGLTVKAENNWRVRELSLTNNPADADAVISPERISNTYAAGMKRRWVSRYQPIQY